VHEYSLVSSLLDRVEAEARARRATAVRRVCLRIGELSGVETDLFRSAYEMLRERSVCARAELEIEAEPGRWRCAECGGEPVHGAALRCPGCGGPLGLVAGDGIILQRIEMEVA
jgi:hydrogenase nickel incorporation protein HypA/HybF